MRTVDSIEALLRNVSNNIDISCIQETHNGKIDTITYDNYTIIYGGCKTVKIDTSNTYTRKAGVAIAVKNILIENICSVQRINGRIMTIEVKTDKKLKNLYIINSYAPHHGYERDEQEEYWEI